MQQRAGPEVGMVVVAKARAPTTVAHEIGHFLGLCHTHADERPLADVALASAQSAAVACGAMCRVEGDGLCDTPFDPGPELCSYDAACETMCRGGDQPDATNLMSYYTACRSRFTRDQVRLMQHSLALRRAWQGCVGGRCPCVFGGKECPPDMSCRPRVLPSGETAPRCTLDGPRPAGSNCEDTTQCGQGALCLHETTRDLKRCARACQDSTTACECVAAGSGLSICREDLGS
ncbi:MAG: M43 family zinc metalloprotease [Myxococcales bacterium]